MAKTAGRRAYKRTYLKDWRILAGLTQEELAVCMDITTGHLANVEAGKRPYTQKTIEAAVACLTARLPYITAGDIISINPADGITLRLLDLARKVPPDRREAATMMLRALADNPSSTDA